MKKLLKTVACLYASIVAATALAESITFNGDETIQGYEFLKFKMHTHDGKTEIEKLTIDENELNKVLKPGENFKEIALIIPGKTQDK